MQILMVSGSRNREGRTARAMEAIGKGVDKAGGKWESIFLPELKIERCRQCSKDGYGICRSEYKCVIEDDFDSVNTKIIKSDVVVFANPVYFFDITESMRAFLDRLRRITPRPGPDLKGNFSLDLPGVSRFMPPKGATPAIGVCLAGGGGRGASHCCAVLERYLPECGFDVVDMITLRRHNLEFKLPILELTGEWLVTKPTSENNGLPNRK
jgi:NAD(P)H-dependent FMN reductase